jgi:hypothetical protein
VGGVGAGWTKVGWVISSFHEVRYSPPGSLLADSSDVVIVDE